jgi:hypothetical protein
MPRPEFTINGVPSWADAWLLRTRAWPTLTSGPIPESLGDTWRRVDRALRDGYRGLPAGSSLARLLKDHRGRPHKHERPPLTEEAILAWADAWHRRAGRWPGVLSGEIPGTGGEVWKRVNYALYIGLRGLPGGDSLKRLLKRAGRRC